MTHMQRRQALKHGATVAGLLMTAGYAPAAWAQSAPFNRAAFDAKTIGDVAKALGNRRTGGQQGHHAERARHRRERAVVPLGAATTIAGAKRVLLLVEKNPNALAGAFDVSDNVEANFATRVKMGQTSNVYAVVVTADNKAFFAQKEVKVTLAAAADKETNMADPMRVRAQAQGSNAVVRVLMAHEMETGQRRDSAGKVIPAWHITEVTAQHNGKPVMTAYWGPAISKNPFLQFTVKSAKAGDKITITWKDNKGESRTDEAVVA